MKYDNQLRYAARIVKEFDGKVPLSSWLRDFFRINKQMGSRDRKTVSELVYGYYRLGLNKFESVEERILAAVHLLNNLPELKEYFKTSPPGFRIENIFPWQSHLSEAVDKEAFSGSFLVQPDLFIRIRPGFEETVVTKLKKADITYVKISDHCLSFTNATRLDSVLEINKEAVIQDFSSQLTGRNLLLSGLPVKEVWDCCAASGGKAIMAVDYLKDISITVSDKRKMIIDALDERFKQAGVSNFISFVADLAKERTVLPDKQYDLVIADVPCSGSGTWARTPEQLYFFREDRIAYYRQLQETIVKRVAGSVKRPGAFLYLTCSVFKEENEEMVEYILKTTTMKLKKMELISGYERKADSMFAALFIA